MNDQQSIERLVRIETQLERITVVLEKTVDDLQKRVRVLEELVQRLLGVLKLIAWLGAPSTAAVIVFLATKAH